ncbi:MAG: glycosyltransferase family 1 protein [Clostridia bacterium]|nr:glycosyltransferase family 1 protein [Clostridia bacterium]
MEPIRVLQVVPNMHRAGLETLIMNIYRNIDREKVQFDFLVHYQARFDYDDEIEALGGKIYRLSVREDNNLFKYLSDLKQFFKKHPEYRVVHGHMESFGFLYSRAAKKAGVKTIIAHSHNAMIEPTLKGRIKSLMNKPWKHYANVLFACSEKAGDFMFEGAPYTVINNGIRCEDFVWNSETRLACRKELGVEDKIVLGHIGRFDPQKNHTFLIDVFAEYAKKHPNVVLLLIGEGAQKNNIQEKINQLNLSSKVQFLGVRSDTARLYQAMDLFLLPSLFEGLPVVGVEAQSAGLPMLTADTVTKELCVTEYVEMLPLEASTETWANKIDEMIENHKRHNTLEEMNATGFNIRKTADFLQKYYCSKY